MNFFLRFFFDSVVFLKCPIHCASITITINLLVRIPHVNFCQKVCLSNIIFIHTEKNQNEKHGMCYGQIVNSTKVDVEREEVFK